MTEIFLYIVNMSITASVLAVIVLLLRLLLKKAPKWISVLLWGLVAIRLICPFAVESPFSLMPKTDWIEQEAVSEDDLFLDSVPDSIPAIDFSSIGEDVTVHYYPIENPEIEIHRGISISFILSCVWIAGMTVLLLHTVISTIRLRRSISAAIRVQDNVWESSAVESPFVLGMICPKIYISRGMTEEKLAYVIAHEQAHIRRRDHWWKPLGFLLLTVHWFNPVIWLAYILLCRDIEMACDERVVREYNDVQRADYSEALLECSVKRSMISACPLAFGEISVKTRIKSVLNYKKPAFWIVVLAVLACAVAAVCFLTNPQMEIDNESVSAMIVDTDTVVSDESAQILVSLINDSRKTYFPVGLDDPGVLSATVQIDCTDGSMYFLHYQYYSGFSLNPAHFGDDDYRSILTYFSPDGTGKKAWRLEYDFDKLFRDWYDEVKPEPEITHPIDERNSVQCRIDGVGYSDTVPTVFFAEGVKRKKDNLPQGIVISKASLTFSVDWDTDVLRVGEEYYENRGNSSTFISLETYELQKNDAGDFVLNVVHRDGTDDESAIYYIESPDGVYMMKLLFTSESEKRYLTLAAEDRLIFDNTIVDSILPDKIYEYRYIPVSISDTMRENLFDAYFGERADEVFCKDEQKDIWQLGETMSGDFYKYGTVSGGHIFTLRYSVPNLNPLDGNQKGYGEVSGCTITAEEAVRLCDELLASMTDPSQYRIDYIHYYGNNGQTPFYWICYKKILEGRTVNAYNDVFFFVDDNGVEEMKGAFYDTEVAAEYSEVLSAEQAVEALSKQLDAVNWKEIGVSEVSRISLEYITVREASGSMKILPIWRMELGKSEEERILNRNRIIGVHAVTGELIQELTGMGNYN